MIRAAAGLAALLAATSCAPAERGEPGRAAVTVLDPTPVMGGWGWMSQNLVFLPLTARDEQGELVGRLAGSWELSPDHRTWTHRLRTDVRWHDGRPVTAHDVAFTIRLLAHSDVLYFTPDVADAVTVVDDSTLTTTGHPYPADTWLVYYPRHLLEHLDPATFGEWDFWTRPVGNGPYRVVRHVQHTLMELEANPDYFGDPPRIERVVLQFGGVSVTELLAGRVDAALLYWNPLDVSRLAADPRFRVYHAYDFGDVKAVAWNQRFEAFRDSRVRRALTLAIDRRELHGTLHLPADAPISDAPYTWRQWQRGELARPVAHDPEEARRLLDEAGWREPRPGAVRERAGAPLRFVLIAEQADERTAVYVQAALRQVGVQVQPRILEQRTVRSLVFQTGEFDAALASFAQRPWVGRGLVAWFGEDSRLGYRNARVARLVDSLAVYDFGLGLEAEEAEALYRELAPHFLADLPMTYLYPVTHFFAAHRRVRGLGSPFRANPVQHMDELWLDPEVPR